MTDTKRMNYTTGQFLVAADFHREQAYHIGQHRLHNRTLHTPGIAGGLEVSQSDDTRIAVAPGTAIDAAGREIALAEAATLDLAGQADGEVTLSVAYEEVQDTADKVAIGGVDVFTATTERARLLLSDPVAETGQPLSPQATADTIVLARIRMGSGRIQGIYPVREPLAGPLLPPSITVQSLNATGWSTIPSLAGAVQVGGDLSTQGKLLATGGNLLFNDLNHASDPTTNTVGFASIQNAADYNALMITGRTVRGADEAGGLLRATKMWDAVEVNGSLSIIAGNAPGDLSVAGQTTLYGVNAKGPAFFQNSMAVGGVLNMSGHITVSGNLTVNGTAYLRAKSGYVMDQFVNRLREPLAIGDVVRIGAAGTVHYLGDGETIPVWEVDLAAEAYDPRVCGIVCDLHGETDPQDRSAAPRIYTQDERARQDLTQVGPNQIGHMVTLGAYASCKVDADIAPIAAGDLLTTSPSRGHAQKVLDRAQAVGAIIGKALAALPSGKGMIPILVTLQ